MTLVKMIKDVIEDDYTAKQITNKICEKYHGYFVKRVEYYNDDVKRTKEQINAEVSSRMCRSKDFNIDRSNGKPYKYSLRCSKKSTKRQITLSIRVEKLETAYKNLHKKFNAQKTTKEPEPVKKHSWWSRWVGRKK